MPKTAPRAADEEAIPNDEHMTNAELRTIREFLGLTGEWLATHLGVNPRTVRDWEQGRSPVPGFARKAVEDIEARTGAFITGIVEHLLSAADVGVIVYRNDAEYHAAHPEIEFPASWHRAVVARVALEVRGLRIAYTEKVAAS